MIQTMCLIIENNVNAMMENLFLERGSGIFSQDVLQGYPDTCAIKCQQLILESNGMEVSETELRNEAAANGWYSPGYGTPMENVGSLLESHGMEVNRCTGASISDIAGELSQGRQVIVGVDSGELWNAGHDEAFEDLIYGGQADHALLVSGITVDPFTAEESILLTDPGTGDVCMEYPAEQFEDAWDDSGNFMVSIN